MADTTLRAFELAALVYLDELFRVARRFSPDVADAEDIVQETYLRAWQSFGRFEQGRNCRAWLYRILFRTLSARRHELQRELALFDAEPLAEDAVCVERAVEPCVTSHQIERAFASLPVAFTAVILLVDVEGLSYREAAEALEVPMGTVMSRLNRARRRLRQLLTVPGPVLIAGSRHQR